MKERGNNEDGRTGGRPHGDHHEVYSIDWRQLMGRTIYLDSGIEEPHPHLTPYVGRWVRFVDHTTGTLAIPSYSGPLNRIFVGPRAGSLYVLTNGRFQYIPNQAVVNVSERNGVVRIEAHPNL